MQIIEFTADSLRFLDEVPTQALTAGFVWIYLDRDTFDIQLPKLQEAASRLGGSALLDLHALDLGNPTHPSHYDYTSVYDLVVFRRLATQAEVMLEEQRLATVTSQTSASVAQQPVSAQKQLAKKQPGKVKGGLQVFQRISSRAVGFAVFDRLLISVHPAGCYSVKNFIDRSLGDAKFSVDAVGARIRLPQNPTDLVLRMVNGMVDSYLDLRKELTTQLEHWQEELLKPNSRFNNWGALMTARSQLHVLEDLCDEQRDSMQEWLDSLREQPISAQSSFAADPRLAQAQQDQLIARARDVIEHIERVVHHARRLEQSAETVVQIHFSAQGNRTNDIMRTLTALTAVFLPLNLITGFFGMNFEFLPLIHNRYGFGIALSAMVLVALVLVLIFWRKRYLARTRG